MVDSYVPYPVGGHPGRFRVIGLPASRLLHSNARLGGVLPHVLHEMRHDLRVQAQRQGATRGANDRVRDATSHSTRGPDARPGRGPDAAAPVGRPSAKTGAGREKNGPYQVLQLHGEYGTFTRHSADPTGGNILQHHADLNVDGLRRRSPRPARRGAGHGRKYCGVGI